MTTQSYSYEQYNNKNQYKPRIFHHCTPNVLTEINHNEEENVCTRMDKELDDIKHVGEGR